MKVVQHEGRVLGEDYAFVKEYEEQYVTYKPNVIFTNLNHEEAHNVTPPDLALNEDGDQSAWGGWYHNGLKKAVLREVYSNEIPANKEDE